MVAWRPLRYDGFWAPVDTLRDVQRLEELAESGAAAVDGLEPGAPRPATVAQRNGGAGADCAAPSPLSAG